MKIKLFLKTQDNWSGKLGGLTAQVQASVNRTTRQKKKQPKSQGVHAKKVTKNQTGEKKSVR